jgi:hypothetical protein
VPLSENLKISSLGKNLLEVSAVPGVGDELIYLKLFVKLIRLLFDIGEFVVVS